MTHSIPFELKVPTDRVQKALDELAAKKGKKFDSMESSKKIYSLEILDISHFLIQKRF